jgi:7-cyano-7-deazaguanine synthase in queuosine biosynthesis
MKVAILNSGGLDSLGAVKRLVENKVEWGITEIISIFIDFNMPTSQAHKAHSIAIADYYDIPNHVVEANLGIDIPQWQSENPKTAGNIAYPSVLCVSLGQTAARMLHCQEMYTGQRSDAFPDVNMFYNMIIAAQAQSRRTFVSTQPFTPMKTALVPEWTIADVVNSIGLDHPLLDSTTSCFKSIPPCGVCYKCVVKSNVINNLRNPPSL